MFEALTKDERRHLAAKLLRAGKELAGEASTLAVAATERPSALAAYALPRDGYHAFYSAAIEASMLSIEVWQAPAFVPTGTGWPVAS